MKFIHTYRITLFCIAFAIASELLALDIKVFNKKIRGHLKDIDTSPLSEPRNYSRVEQLIKQISIRITQGLSQIDTQVPLRLGWQQNYHNLQTVLQIDGNQVTLPPGNQFQIMLVSHSSITVPEHARATHIIREFSWNQNQIRMYLLIYLEGHNRIYLFNIGEDTLEITPLNTSQTQTLTQGDLCQEMNMGEQYTLSQGYMDNIINILATQQEAGPVTTTRTNTRPIAPALPPRDSSEFFSRLVTAFRINKDSNRKTARKKLMSRIDDMLKRPELVDSLRNQAPASRRGGATVRDPNQSVVFSIQRSTSDVRNRVTLTPSEHYILVGTDPHAEDEHRILLTGGSFIGETQGVIFAIPDLHGYFYFDRFARNRANLLTDIPISDTDFPSAGLPTPSSTQIRNLIFVPYNLGSAVFSIGEDVITINAQLQPQAAITMPERATSTGGLGIESEPDTGAVTTISRTIEPPDHQPEPPGLSPSNSQLNALSSQNQSLRSLVRRIFTPQKMATLSLGGHNLFHVLSTRIYILNSINEIQRQGQAPNFHTSSRPHQFIFSLHRSTNDSFNNRLQSIRNTRNTNSQDLTYCINLPPGHFIVIGQLPNINEHDIPESAHVIRLFPESPVSPSLSLIVVHLSGENRIIAFNSWNFLDVIGTQWLDNQRQPLEQQPVLIELSPEEPQNIRLMPTAWNTSNGSPIPLGVEATISYRHTLENTDIASARNEPQCITITTEEPDSSTTTRLENILSVGVDYNQQIVGESRDEYIDRLINSINRNLYPLDDITDRITDRSDSRISKWLSIYESILRFRYQVIRSLRGISQNQWSQLTNIQASTTHDQQIEVRVNEQSTALAISNLLIVGQMHTIAPHLQPALHVDGLPTFAFAIFNIPNIEGVLVLWLHRPMGSLAVIAYRYLSYEEEITITVEGTEVSITATRLGSQEPEINWRYRGEEDRTTNTEESQCDEACSPRAQTH